jgi:hypothetical protein
MLPHEWRRGIEGHREDNQAGSSDGGHGGGREVRREVTWGPIGLEVFQFFRDVPENIAMVEGGSKMVKISKSR